MLILEVILYLRRRANKKPLRQANLLLMHQHHCTRRTEPKVSIIIPTRDKYDLLHACLESINNKTTYSNYEILIVNNESSDPQTLDYLERLRSQGYVVLNFPEPFNYSKICNFASENSSGEYLCFLNNDTAVLEPRWLDNLLDHAVQPGVGVVGSKLLYEDDSIQHMGIALGYTGVAGHIYRQFREYDPLISNLLESCFEVSAVTFACAIVKTSTYRASQGLDVKYRVGLNDVDFCIRLREAGFRNIVCCHSSLRHLESKSRSRPFSLKGFSRALYEVLLFLNRKSGHRDHYFNQ